jgi:catechol 2,3-dioxygenase-like lactoylglutathione lyase family enzyme
MKLGAFSVSLAVKDLQASKNFYEALGFSQFHGDEIQGWLIMKNEDGHAIGLFQGMFEKNLMTFNPGWDGNAKEIDAFDDIREIQKHLKDQGITFITEADENSAGPASFMVEDPDGNPVLVDQHR